MSSPKKAPNTAAAQTIRSNETEWRAHPPRPLSPQRRSEFTAALTASETGRVCVNIDPDDLVFGKNIRSDAATTIDADFLASITQDGFEQPPVVWISTDGYVQVKFGHRRTLAARQAGYNPCPVTLVHPPTGRTNNERRADEIGSQWSENTHRLDMSRADEVRAVEEMLDLGLSVTKVKDRLTGISRAEVTAIQRLHATTSPAQAREAALAGQLDLVQAAAVAELDPTEQELTALVNAARNGTFDNVLIRTKHHRRSAAALHSERAKHTKKGYTILDREPGYWDTNKPTPLTELITPGGRPATIGDVTSPAHWAIHLTHTDTPVLVETGEPVAEDSIDPATFLDASAPAAEGMVHAEAIRYESRVTATYYCLDRKGAGLKPAPKPGTTPNTDQGAANKRAHKANTGARIDTEARRTFLKNTLFKRKTLPKGVIHWMTHLLLSDPQAFTDTTARIMAADFLGVKDRNQYTGMAEATAMAHVLGYDDTAPVDKQKPSDQRALMIIATIAVAAAETLMQRSDKHPSYWRCTQHDPHTPYTGDTTNHARYLRVLASAGYTPGPIERAVLGEISLTQAITDIDNPTP